MADRLKDKVAIVTGAGSIGPGWGNGKATAVLYAREGAKVLAVDINEAAVAETKAIVDGEGGVCEAVTADVSSGDDVAGVAARCRETFGRIDILHNNVGILAVGGPADLDETDWERSFATNIRSMYLTCKHVLPVMEAQGGGVVVNIASIAGIRELGLPYVAYSTTKGAVLPFTRSIAVEYAGKNIRANCVLPGLIDTPMVTHTAAQAYADTMAGGDLDAMREARIAQIPMARMGEAWDVAHAALFLASDDAKYITGVELVVDGGITCKVGL